MERPLGLTSVAEKGGARDGQVGQVQTISLVSLLVRENCVLKVLAP